MTDKAEAAAELRAALQELLDHSGWANMTDGDLEEEAREGNGKAPIILRCRAALKAQSAPTEAQGEPNKQLFQNIEELQSSGNTGELAAQGEDSARLEFMIQQEAWIAWSKDGESCRLFHRSDDGEPMPMLGWGARHWSHDPREAIDRARASAEKGGVKS